MTKLTTEPMGQQLKDNVKVKLADEVKVDLVDDVIADDENVTPITTTETTCVKIKKKRDASTLRKAPQAPKRFKSSYIMFFMAKQQEIKAELGGGASVSSHECFLRKRANLRNQTYAHSFSQYCILHFHL